jgi:hypothetical protein
MFSYRRSHGVGELTFFLSIADADPGPWIPAPTADNRKNLTLASVTDCVAKPITSVILSHMELIWALRPNLSTALQRGH